MLVRSWRSRVAVVGGSMEPTLRAGDWLLVDPVAYRRRAPASGDLVVAPDPREPTRVLVKRVARIDEARRLIVVGDARDASTDSRVFGSIAASEVAGRPWFRYWPLRRIGRVR